MPTPPQSKKDKKLTFVILTKDFSGLGYAKRLTDEGHLVIVGYDFDEEDEKKNGSKMVGKGHTTRYPLEELWKKRANLKDAYWLIDQNNEGEKLGDQLRAEGFKRVLGGSALADRMEHDRDFGVAMVKRAGLDTPPTLEFTDPKDGLAFLDEHQEKAYVFKPNTPSDGWETFVPDSEKDEIANQELYSYLEALPAGNTGGYILQERIRGVEANFEIWLHKGKPFFACCDLECKKKNNDDLGGLVGGASDIGFFLPLDAKGVRETVGKIAKLPEFKDYTGFVDANVIIADNGPYFLEFCARFGYPAHVSLFFQMPRISVGDVFAKIMDGDVADFYDAMRYGFVAGITLNCEKPRKGLPVFVPEDLDDKFYIYDTYKRGDITLTAGLALEVGVMTAHGFTIMDAAELATERARKVAFPNRSFRTDLARDDYPSNPRDRYLALEAMRYLVP